MHQSMDSPFPIHRQMMPSPFDLPEIASVIFTFLSRGSLVKCLRVCKVWNRHCLPLVWENIALHPFRPAYLYELVQLDYQQHGQSHNEPQGLDTSLGLASSTIWARSLIIQAFSWHHGRLDISAVNHMLRLCPNIRSLELDLYQEAPYSIDCCGTAVEELTLRGFIDQELTLSIARRCQGLTTLIFGQLKRHMVRHVVELIQRLPKIVNLDLSVASSSLADKDYADILSACPTGWRQLRLATMGLMTADAVAAHRLTLEWLEARSTFRLTDHQLIELFFVASPCLRGIHLPNRTLDAKAFIDLDPTTGQLRPWECEKSLTDLRVMIGGIPRPDVTHNQLGKLRHEDDATLHEDYPGQGRSLQQQVLTRMGRLRGLQCLELGLKDLNLAERDGIKYSANYQGPYEDRQYQYECLEMNIAAGLDHLRLLKQLRYLNIGRMATRMSSDEMDWILEHWPQLQTIEGLCWEEESDAYFFLIDRRNIKAIPFHRIE